jgi:hypothetical protein
MNNLFNTSMLRSMLSPFAAVMLLAIAACGGGGSSASRQDDTGAVSGAPTSVVAFTAWMQDQIATGSESAEPRPVQDIDPPVSDVSEPALI